MSCCTKIGFNINVNAYKVVSLPLNSMLVLNNSTKNRLTRNQSFLGVMISLP